MNKNLLTLSCLLCLGATALAQNSVLPDVVLTSVSRNGQYAAGALDNGTVTFINLATNEIKTYESDGSTTMYYVGNGVSISDDGILVGATCDENAAYCIDDVWTPLPIGNTGARRYTANTIAADGSIICGGIGMGDFTSETSAFLYPCVWERNADGTYGDPVMLPHPDTDFSGRVPQYILAVNMSADGTRIIGQLTDYTGFEHEPLLWTRDADGKWSYTAICPELINPSHIEIPEYPGDGPSYPDQNDYMTSAELAAYNEAVTAYSDYFRNRPEYADFISDDHRLDYEDAMMAYYDDPENNPYPFITEFMSEEEMEAYNTAVEEFYANAPEYPEYSDFMTEENRAKYVAAVEEYQAVYSVWEEKYYAFSDALNEALEESPSFIFNNISINYDGTKGISTGVHSTFDPMTWNQTSESTIYVFDLENNTYTAYTPEDVLVSVSLLADNRALVNTYPGNSIYNQTYILDLETSEFTPIQDFMAAQGDTGTVEFINDNMKHSIESWDPETYDPIVLEDQYITGVSHANESLSVIVSWVENIWDWDSDSYYYTYIMRPDLQGVQAAVADADFAVALSADGTLTVTGRADTVTVYDLNGRTVFTAAGIDAPVATGLSRGAYIVRAVAGDNVATVKAII